MRTVGKNHFAAVTLVAAVSLLPLADGCAFAAGDKQAAAEVTELQDQAPSTGIEIAPEYESPRATLTTFFSAMERATAATDRDDTRARDEALKKAISTMDLSEVNAERAAQLAVRLLGVLNRLGPFRSWYLWDRPAADNSGKEEQTYFPHPRFTWVVIRTPGVEPDGDIVLAKQKDGRWLFSGKTVAGLDVLYISLEKMPVRAGQDEKKLSSELWLRQLMPTSLKGRSLLTLELWQWVGLAVFIFLGLILDHTFRFLVRTTASKVIRRQGGDPDPVRLRQAVRPAGLAVVALFWLNLVWVLGLPDLAFTIVQAAARVFAVLAITWFAWRFADLLADVAARKAATTETKLDDVLVPLVRTTTKIFIVIFALIYGGLSLNVDVTPLLASLTIGGVGFAFAAKDTLENFFGSATVLVDQPFGVGDWVVIGDVEGTVEMIGFRSTRVRTFYDSIVTIPNANLVRATVDNNGRRRYRRYSTMLGIEYGTPPEKISTFVEGIREIIRAHPYTRKDYFHVWFTGFGPASLDIMVYTFFTTPDWSMEMRERERLLLDIARLANYLSIEFAFPTQTIHVKQGEAPPESWAAPTANTDEAVVRDAQEAVRHLTKDQAWREAKPGAVSFSDPAGSVSEDTSPNTQADA